MPKDTTYRTLHTPAAAEDLIDPREQKIRQLTAQMAELEQTNRKLAEQLGEKQRLAAGALTETAETPERPVKSEGGKKSTGALLLGLAAAAILVVAIAFGLNGGDRQEPGADTAGATPEIISNTEGSPEETPAPPEEETVPPEPEETEQVPPETTQNDVDYADGIAYVDGTFQVSNGSGLAAFRDIVNGDNIQLVEGYSETEAPNDLPDSDALLTADLDLADVSQPEDGSWMPIGARGAGYYGTFDGGGHTIYNLYGRYYSYALTYAKEEDDVHPGGCGLFAQNGGLIRALTVSGEIDSAVERVGGIVGINEGIISECTSYVSITSSEKYVGGIAGANEIKEDFAKIQFCANFGDLTSSEEEEPKMGGICGGNWRGAMTVSCYNVGELRAPDVKYCGGIAGKAVADSIVNCCYLSTSNQCGENWDLTEDPSYIASQREFADGTVLDILQTTSGAPWRQENDYPVCVP